MPLAGPCVDQDMLVITGTPPALLGLPNAMGRQPSLGLCMTMNTGIGEAQLAPFLVKPNAAENQWAGGS